MASPASTEATAAAPVVTASGVLGAAEGTGTGWISGLALDGALLCLGLALAIALRFVLGGVLGAFEWSAFAVAQYGACALIGLILLVYEGVYAGGLAYLEQTDRLVKALTGGLGATILYSFATQRSAEVSRFVLIAGYFISLLLFILVRPLLRRWCRHNSGVHLLAADRETARRLRNLAATGIQVHTEPLAGVPGRTGGVVIACLDERTSEDQVAAWESRLGALGLIPTSCDLTALGAEPVNLYGIQVFSISHPLARRFNRAVKRGCDLLGAALLLGVTAPAWGVIAALVRSETPGPALFAQERLGRNGRPFRAWKFRSMHADADRRLQSLLAANPERANEFRASFKLRQDPRVTRVGRFLRRTSLDELPQLWNVLRGDMSLVGPRPIVAEERALYGAAYPVVATVRPGLTGIWQTSGRNEAAYESRKHFDVFYVRRWTVWLDLAILIRTLQAMVLPADY